MNNASIDSILFRCHCPKVMAKPVTILNANHCHEGGYAFCLLLLLLAQVSRAVKHCRGNNNGVVKLMNLLKLLLLEGGNPRQKVAG
jgi:hypothetical protein